METIGFPIFKLTSSLVLSMLENSVLHGTPNSREFFFVFFPIEIAVQLLVFGE